MGTHIDAYVVDPVAFNRHLDQPLSSVLEAICRAPSQEERLFHVYIDKTQTRYTVGIGRVGKYTPNRPYETIAPDQLHSIPELQTSLRDHLNSESSYALDFLLHDFPLMGIPECVHQIIRGEKRFWIGSLLGAAESVWYATPPMKELAHLMARILRGKKAFFRLDWSNTPPTPDQFPVFPNNDADKLLGILSPPEFTRLRELLQELLQHNIEFGPPPLDPTFCVDHDWTDAVLQYIHRFLNAPLLPNATLVTFIG